MTLGEKIKKLRQNQKLTLEALANSIDSSKSYIWEIENYAEKRPSVKIVGKIAECLGVTVDYLISPKVLELSEEEEIYVIARELRALCPELREMLRQQIKVFKRVYGKVNW